MRANITVRRTLTLKLCLSEFAATSLLEGGEVQLRNAVQLLGTGNNSGTLFAVQQHIPGMPL